METQFEASYDLGSAQMADSAAAGAIAAFSGVAFIFAIAIYVYMAICLMKIAKKTGAANAWFAWVPILNLVLMIKIAGKPMWWLALFLLMFIPFVGPVIGLIIAVLLWMEIAAAVGKEKWLGILMIVPLVNLVIPGYLAFAKNGSGAAPSKSQEPKKPEKKESVDLSDTSGGSDIDMD